MLANERDDLGWVYVANDDRLCAKCHTSSSPTATSNVEQRHCHHVHGAIGELPNFCSKRNERKEVVVREHDALRPARGTA